MSRALSAGLQVVMLAILVAAGTVLWVERDRVGDAVASFTKTGDEQRTKPAKRTGDREVPVIVARVEQARNVEVVAAVGTARARRSVMLQAKADGVIVQITPRVGDRVLAGDMIFQLDSTKTELAVQIARRKLEEAKRQVDRAKILERSRVNSNARTEDANTVFERASLELQQAQDLLNDMKIRAPFEGVLGIPKVEIGDQITKSTPIISLDMRGEILVEFEIAEQFLTRIAPGDAITGITPSHGDEKFAGRIEHIDSRIDPVSRTVAVRAVIPNDKDQLRPGMSFVVELVLMGGTHPTIPELSLQWRKGESYVWIVRDGKAEKVLIRAVKRLNSIILVEGELKPDDLVVVEGVQRLREGSKVIHSVPEPPAAQSGETAKTVDPQKG